MSRIILASKSPRRKMLLEQINLPFSIEPSNYEEDMGLDMEPVELAKFLALKKAETVAEIHKDEDVIIIGADTFIICEEEIMGKARTDDQARVMLKKISGKKHTVITGLAVIKTPGVRVDNIATVSTVWFAELSDQDINDYIASGEPIGKAAAYAIQEVGGKFVRKVEGSYTGIVGLPLFELSHILT